LCHNAFNKVYMPATSVDPILSSRSGDELNMCSINFFSVKWGNCYGLKSLLEFLESLLPFENITAFVLFLWRTTRPRRMQVKKQSLKFHSLPFSCACVSWMFLFLPCLAVVLQIKVVKVQSKYIYIFFLICFISIFYHYSSWGSRAILDFLQHLPLLFQINIRRESCDSSPQCFVFS